MTAAVDLRCSICGARWPLETAVTAHGPEYVCEDGYACAVRANGQREGKARFAVVTSPVTAPSDAEPATPRNR